jgi:hypothetical protein
VADAPLVAKRMRFPKLRKAWEYGVCIVNRERDAVSMMYELTPGALNKSFAKRTASEVLENGDIFVCQVSASGKATLLVPRGMALSEEICASLRSEDSSLSVVWYEKIDKSRG